MPVRYGFGELIMVDEQVVERERLLLAHIRHLVSPGAALLFEILVEPDEDAASFSYCFFLATPEGGNGYRITSCLMLPAMDADEVRAAKVAAWLAAPDRTLAPRIFGERAAGGTERGRAVFIPSRVPRCYTYYGTAVSFMRLF